MLSLDYSAHLVLALLQLEDPELQQLGLVPGVLDLRLQPLLPVLHQLQLLRQLEVLQSLTLLFINQLLDKIGSFCIIEASFKVSHFCLGCFQFVLVVINLTFLPLNI